MSLIWVSGVLTDWITSKIALIEEEVWDLGASSIVKISNKSLDLTWIKDGEDTYFINKTDNTCAYNKTLQVPYGISDRVLKIFNSTGQNLASIVKSVIDFSNSTTGYYIIEKQPPVVAGMEGIHWLACKNGSKPEDPALLVEVLFSGDQIEPPTLNISKQIMLSLRIGEFNGSFTENNTSPYSYIHIEFDKLALAKPKETQIKLPPGQVCSGLKNTTLPLKQVDEFYGVIEDEVKLTSTKVFYSSSNGIVAESSSAKPYPFFNEASDAAQIVHSFKYGYEFTFSQTNCQEMKTLLNTTNDVVTDDKGLHLKPFLQILFNTNLNFSKFTPTKTEGNITVDVYRATDLDNSTVELFIIKDELYSIRRYVNNELKSDQRIIPLPINGFSLSQLEFGLRSCYQPPTISSHVDTVMVELPGKSLADVFSVGLETFTNAFAQAMNQIGQISPLRISVFPVIKSSEALDLVVNVAEKTQIQPGSVGANFTTEDVSSAFIEALNKTLAKGDIEFKVNQQSWKISSNTLTRFPEAHTKCWYGFSGGSMFVLGIFAFMLGIALGAGGILFINRRKQISTLAYQVFE
ncbi:hypothetical protein WR25_11282 [Diploscapter pachys]|uniref:Uncharacterized protein n=1 Tax=Diploscapter pachys TaxID=2018661 RepID=A0A2A2KBA6_9BILA|nr:hypothetical protein WR25_11282 [Diploscapter pachys]